MGDPQDVIADRLLEMLVPGRNSANSTITVHHDGKGTWIAVTACLLMLTVSGFLTALYLDVREDQRDTAAHLQTIYMLIPDLRKEVEGRMGKTDQRENVK